METHMAFTVFNILYVLMQPCQIFRKWLRFIIGHFPIQLRFHSQAAYFRHQVGCCFRLHCKEMGIFIHILLKL